MKTSLCALPELYAITLASLAPSIAFSVSREVDELFRWDGDGPDPIEEGFDPYDITVTARAIIDGSVIEGQAYLGGSYFRSDEPTDTIHGYLNQMLEEAAQDLRDTLIRAGFPLRPVSVFSQIDAAIGWLKEQRTREYNAQRAEIEGSAK